MTSSDNCEVDLSKLNTILEKLEKLHHIRDVHTLLDSILNETRALTNADAGSIFLVENNKLKFCYVQNDSLFKSDFLSNKYVYSNNEIDIDEKSLAGYVALTKESLLIDDAYEIGPSKSYSFNPYFDQISSYKTKSMLIVPLKTSKNDMVGVLELINCKCKGNKPIPFTNDQKFFITQFAFYAGITIERALMLRDIVFKMVKTTELRDPEETKPHVNRVSSYTMEIYKKWAENHHVPKSEINNYKDILKISSILHDIGKVGISDVILKKNGKLTSEEFEIMKMHTVFGARFFENPHSEWDTLAYEIALNHHEKWDGSGYPGFVEDINLAEIKFGKGKKGAEIPLSSRIVAIADVYDALMGKRSYKDPWEEDKVLYHIKEQSGKHFDPEIVQIFFEIYDVIKAIRNKWE